MPNYRKSFFCVKHRDKLKAFRIGLVATSQKIDFDLEKNRRTNAKKQSRDLRYLHTLAVAVELPSVVEAFELPVDELTLRELR